jgi:hypothetical protein
VKLTKLSGGTAVLHHGNHGIAFYRGNYDYRVSRRIPFTEINIRIMRLYIRLCLPLSRFGFSLWYDYEQVAFFNYPDLHVPRSLRSNVTPD